MPARTAPEWTRHSQAVEGHQPDPLLGRELFTKAKVQPGTGGPVEVHHHGAIGVTRVPDPQYPPAATYLHLAHLTIVMPPPPESNERPGNCSQLPVGGHALTRARAQKCAVTVSSESRPGLPIQRRRSSEGRSVAHESRQRRRTAQNGKAQDGS
jgi:hypothetical protein